LRFGGEAMPFLSGFYRIFIPLALDFALQRQSNGKGIL
jgi:hypothetical protein